MPGILIIGAGGHGKVVADILLSSGSQVLGFLDDDRSTWQDTRLGLPVLGAINDYMRFEPDGLAMGIGSNLARSQVAARLGNADALWRTAVHPRASVSPFTRLGRGTVVAAGAVVNPDTLVGDFAILNTGCSVDHDCVIGDYAHIAPGAHLSGSVNIGEGCLIGVGAAVSPGCMIGKWAIVGAGAAVVRHVPDGATAKGVPARW